MEPAKTQKYRFFSFRTSRRFASDNGWCSGQVNLQTGTILASICYGLHQYREIYRLNVSDQVNPFPCTMEDAIIHAARKAARD